MQKINLRQVLRDRLPVEKSRFIPGFLIGWLERFIHQKELNEVLEFADPAVGTEFCRKVYEFFDLELDVRGLENIPEQGRFIFASNHPLGGLDGIGLIKVLGERYGDDGIAFLVNDMLMNVGPLRPVFLPINKYGSQGRDAVMRIAEEYAGPKQMIIFPAGLVSRLGDNGAIADLKWHKSFVEKAVEYRRDIIPVHFEGRNRMRFYRTARWRKKLGMKANIEQAMLPGELCAARGCRFSVSFGKPVSWQSLHDSGKPFPKIASELREYIYKLKDK